MFVFISILFSIVAIAIFPLLLEGGAVRGEPRLSLDLLISYAIILDILFKLFPLSGIELAKILPVATVVSPFEF